MPGTGTCPRVWHEYLLRRDGRLLKLLRGLFRRDRPAPPVRPRSLQQEEEDYEIAESERAAWAESRRFRENLIKKIGHSRLPFLDDPFD